MTRRELYCQALGLPQWQDPVEDMVAWCQRAMASVQVPDDLVVTRTELRANQNGTLVQIHYGKPDERA